MEEVVVTARRVEESLQDTPVSVAVFSQMELEKMGVSEVGDVGNFTPNTEIRKQPGRHDNYAISIRGASNGELSLAVDPTVGVYLDGIYLARSAGMAFDLVDIKRMEVLRGPQGTLFGRNAVGGAINVITAKPKGEFALKQQVKAGSRALNRTHTMIDTPRVGGIAAKLSLLHVEQDGDLESIYTGVNLGRKQSRAARAAFNWQPVDTITVDYSFDWSRMKGNAQTFQISHVRDAYADPDGAFYGGPFFETAKAQTGPERRTELPININDENEATADVDMHTLIMEWDLLPQLTIKSLSGYREWESLSRENDVASFPAPADGSVCEFDNYDFILGVCSQPVPAGELVTFWSTHLLREQRQFSQELQFIGSVLDGRLSYITGLYYFQEDARSVYRENPQVTISAAAAVAGVEVAPGVGLVAQNRGNTVTIPLFPRDASIDNTAYATYGEFTWSPLTELDISLGLRYTVDERAMSLTNSLKDNPEAAGNTAVPQTVKDSDTWSDFSPSLTITYRWSPEFSTYVKAVTSYRAGGYNLRANNVESFKKPVDEENVLSYEIGWKSDLFERTLRLNGAVFYMDYTDRQVAQFEAGTGGGAAKIVNAGKSVNSGIELDTIWLPFDGMKVIAAYGFLDQNFKEFIAGVVDPVTAMPTGDNRNIADRVPENLYAARHSGSLTAEYTFTPRTWGTLALRSSANYTGSITFHPQLNLFDESEARTLINARATLADIPLGRNKGGLELALWGNNLAGKDYREFGIDFAVLGFATTGYGAPRSYGMDIVYRFNR